MRQTPRSSPITPRSRGFGTLIGNGWLRESPRDPFPIPRWDVRGGRSALRKCMFMPVPEQLRGLFPQVSASAVPIPMPVYRPARAEEMVPHRRDGRKDAREFAAFVPGNFDPRNFDPRNFDPRNFDPRAAAQHARALEVHNAQRAAVAAATKAPGPWWEDPVALGSLLILVPPIGLAAVWSSRRYSSDARWALTVMTALTMCLMTAVIVAVLSMR